MYCSVEQAERIVLLSSIDDGVNPIVRDVFEKNRAFSLSRTSHTIVNEEERTLYTNSSTITFLTKKVIEGKMYHVLQLECSCMYNSMTMGQS